MTLDDGRVTGVTLENGDHIDSRYVVMALGHSARDTFRMLHRQGVYVEAKPFAIGFRIEHPQSLIDKARLGKYAGHPELGAADYKLVHHAKTAAPSTASACARAGPWSPPPPNPGGSSPTA